MIGKLNFSKNHNQVFKSTKRETSKQNIYLQISKLSHFSFALDFFVLEASEAVNTYTKHKDHIQVPRAWKKQDKKQIFHVS